MTIDQLIAQVRATIAARLATRAEHTSTIEQIRAACHADNERDPSTTEVEQVTQAREARAAIDAEIGDEATPAAGTLRFRLNELLEEQRADERAATLLREVTPAPGATQPPAYDRVHRVGQEQRTYRPDERGGVERSGGQFLRDLATQFLYNDPGAAERLNRHMAEERVERGAQIEGMLDRAAGTGAFAGLTVPQFLTDFYAPAARALRPLADAMRKHDLPSQGMTVNISRITTGTSVAVQAAENTGVSETNIDDTLLTIPIQTSSGQQTLSRQSIERSTGAEDAMLDDLFRAYATTLDNTIITQAATGLSAAVQGGNTVAYTDATPTAAELWPKFLDAQQRVESALLSADTDSDAVIMHARRWAWLQSQVGPNWPFIAQMNTPVQAGGVNDGAKQYGAGYRGRVAGLNVIVDNNIQTTLGAGTEDEAYVVNLNECHLWEDPSAPVLIRAEQPAAASLGVLFVVYGYFAYTFGRYPLAVAKVNGTGFIAPTF
jgi:hypothetical protein